MKNRLFAVVLTLVMLVAVFAACTPQEDDAPTMDLSVYVPDGAPAMAVANIISSGKIGEHNAHVTISTGEKVTEAVGKQEADVAILPTNACAKLCSTGGKYQMFTVNVFGLLYVIGYQNVTSLADLAGKSVLSIGLSNTGEYLFKKILQNAGVSYEGEKGVSLKYYSDGSEAGKTLIAGQGDFALLGEPAATNFINKAAQQGKTLYRVFDLQQEWKKVVSSDIVGYPQASVIVKKSLLDGAEGEAFAKTLLKTLQDNSVFLTENVAGLKDILVMAGSSLQVDYTADIVSRCNLRTEKAEDVKADVKTYLEQFGANFAAMLKDEIYYDFNF